MEFKLENFVRPNILDLKPYNSLRESFTDEDLILLEANENPFGKFNRYPDSKSVKLRQKFSEINDVKPEQIFIGNGSDELIDLIIRAFGIPGKDSIMVMNPSFVMYEFYGKVNDLKVEKLNLNQDFQIDKEDFDSQIKTSKSKLLFLCSPNNPTGNSIANLEYFISNFNGIVVVDEAYIEFSKEISAVCLLDKYPNLIVLKTLSKAFGMAGLRIGIGFASKEISDLITTMKPPYNVSSENQNLALENLSNDENFEENLNLILSERDQLKEELVDLKIVSKIYNSDCNFLLIEFENVELVYKKLLENKIFTSLRHPAIEKCLRINVGNPSENDSLVSVLNQLSK
ncbi:histidinol-phosphate transaminase [Halpernia frigidisoli]|uniref:Histidinol-phosphate aminotransferase n=1 Tax=Halpernia frigidisoli TaxID=1125876 RepID=A0A1I3CUZ9_9FLAO|nr:histidinol-phosphate transaminase [Halpernia frigidisoli]SFH78253.1 histidinol-phosphate aminotransferase [Halpernia frigidisoli]